MATRRKATTTETPVTARIDFGVKAIRQAIAQNFVFYDNTNTSARAGGSGNDLCNVIDFPQIAATQTQLTSFPCRSFLPTKIVVH